MNLRGRENTGGVGGGRARNENDVNLILIHVILFKSFKIFK